MNWILISEQAPKPGQLVVLYFESHGTVWSGRFNEKQRHWLPLPEVA